MIKMVIFDLDGTLADTSEGIINSHIYAHQMMHRCLPSKDYLYSLIGGNLLQVYINELHFSEVEAREAIRYYREYYQQKGIFEARLYDGIPELLTSLKHKSLKIGLATLKAEKFAEPMMEQFGIKSLFDCIFGMDSKDSRTKPSIISMCIESQNIHPAETVMVGDTEQDRIGASICGTDFIGVTYGFGFKGENSGEQLCSDPGAIGQEVMKRNKKYDTED